MKPISLKNAVSLSHLIVQSYIPTAKIIVDMTCGNGHDTEFLARQMDPESVLYAFDIQTRAVETTKKRIRDAGLAGSQIRVQCGSHDILLEQVEGQPDIILFNLGYLPKGDHSLHTKKEITIKAIQIGLHKIAKNGIIIVAAYPGTEAGRKESEAVQDMLGSLLQQQFHVSRWQPLNEVNEPPVLYMIQKRGNL